MPEFINNDGSGLIGGMLPSGVGEALQLDSSGNLYVNVAASTSASATATRSSVAAANSDTSLLASNSSRKGALFFNDSTATLYLAYGSGAASTSSYTVQIAPNGFFEMPPPLLFTGAIRGIWSAAKDRKSVV